MREATFELKVKDGGWSHHPDRWKEPDARMVSFTLVALKHGKPIGGHNIQAHIGAAARRETPASEVDMRLGSGWYVSFRNQFAQAPDVAGMIIASVEGELSSITAELERARGAEMFAAKERLWATTFRARGPNYWC